MIEIRFHGRGGQGAVLASELLAHAAFLDGHIPQSFPFFGVERRGAPVTAYCRIDDRPIRVRTGISAPDVVVVLDPGLVRSTDVTSGLKEGGLLLVNTPVAPSALDAPAGVRRASVDANRIALRQGLGSATMPIVNTAMLGALARASGCVSLPALGRAIEANVPARPHENGVAAAEGFDAVRLDSEGPRAALHRAKQAPAPLPLPEGPVASVPSSVLHTSAWRTLRPVIDRARCTRCNFCWKFCPDVAVELDPQGYPLVRYEYCKGCGICAEECPPRSIAMVEEG